MMRIVDGLIFRPIASVRPYLMAKGVLLLLGLDCIVDLVAHGGRYGIGGFNVAHFAVLDHLVPTPSPATYVGSLFLISGLSFVLFFGRLRRALLVVLTLLYTYAWASSLLDAYQHHYLLSLLLVSMCAFPTEPLREVLEIEPAHPQSGVRPAANRVKGHSRPKGRRSSHVEGDADARTPSSSHTVEAPGYVSFVLTCAIVYAFTAVMKLDPDWRSGHALSRIVDPSTLDPLFFWFAPLNLSESQWYLWLARGAIGFQVVCALALVASVFADTSTTGRRRAIAAAIVAPLAFHATTESLDLEIGWFSKYMVLIVFVALLPASWLRGVLRVPAWVRGLDRPGAPATRESPEKDERFTLTIFALLATVVTPIAFANVDLPGALGAGLVLTALGMTTFVVEERRGLGMGADLALALPLAGVLCFACLAHPALGFGAGDDFVGVSAATVRYDYYRFVGGDFWNRRDVANAISAYEKALRYAPTAELRESTRRKIANLRSGR